MYTSDLLDIPIEIFGGYCPAIPPSDLPPGAAAIAQDVVFPMGGLRSRGGLSNAFPNSTFAGATINGLKSYITPTLQQRLLVWLSTGFFYKESPQGTLVLVSSRPFTGTNLFYQSITLFGREYQAFFNVSGGTDIPRQFDDTNWDRVSQGGPGLAPTAADNAVAGNITAGKRNVSVAFITRQGLITMAAPPGSWTAAGGFQASITAIPIGPSNVVARLLLFSPVIASPATLGNLYSLPAGSSLIASSTMLINDNTTTTATVDFTDAILQTGFNANYLLSQVELGEVSSFIGYNSRLVALGERNHISNAVNLEFEGGFSGATPLGWTTVNAGGGSAVTGGFAADWGDAYSITGDGATAQRGKITQTAYLDYLGVPIVARNTTYSVRVRATRNNTLTQGTLHINLNSVSGAFTTVGLSIGALTLPVNSYVEFTASLTNAALATPPADLLLQVYADGTPTNNGVFLIDSIEIYPTNAPFNYSTARFSYAFNPEAFHGVTGQVQVRPNDGQQMRASFPLRNNLYLAKDHYLCYVSDDGVNEPSGWSVNEVSGTVGICGPNAVDWTEEWAVFAERSGAYICWGSDPVKITPEIQTDASGTGKIAWDSIDWAQGHTIWVRIDKINKMILIGVPTDKDTAGPNKVFMMDYRWLTTAQEIADSPMPTYSGFSGKALAHGKGRRWSLWNITASSMTFAERINGTAQPFFGDGSGNGLIFQQIDAPTQVSDNGVAIPWNYQGYGSPSHMEEQAMQLGAHRKLLGYSKFRAIGAGTLGLAISTTLRSTLLRSYTLSASPGGDGERPLNLHGERFYFTIRQNASLTSWFQMEKLILCMKKDASIPVRGMSA